MHIVKFSLLACLFTTSLAAGDLDTRELKLRAVAACASIAQEISGASEVYYAGPTFSISPY